MSHQVASAVCHIKCRSREAAVDEYEAYRYYEVLSVNDRLRLAQSYFLLGSVQQEQGRAGHAYALVERALRTFRDCNTAGCRIRCGDAPCQRSRHYG